MPITYDYYIYLISLGIPYEGEVQMPDGTILISVKCTDVVQPEHQHIFNPPRFTETDNCYRFVQQCVLILPPQQNKQAIDIDKTAAKLYNKLVTNNNNGTITVNMGFGNSMTIPVQGSEVKITITDNAPYMKGPVTPTFTMNVKDGGTGEFYYVTMKLADTDVVFSNQFNNGNNGNNSGKLLGTMQDGLALSGFALGIAEHSAGISTFRTHRMSGTKFSPKYYRSGWRGGSRGKIKTHSAAKVLKTAGKVVFFVSFLIEGHLYFEKEQSLGKSITNVVFSGVSTFGGIPGLIVGIAYFGLDALGVFDGDIAPVFRDDFYELYPTVRPDKTRVVMQSLYPMELYNNKELPILNSHEIQKLLLEK